MAPLQIQPDDIAGLLKPGVVLVSSTSTESVYFSKTFNEPNPKLPAVTVGGIFLPGLNKHAFDGNPQPRVLTSFMTPELAQSPDRVEFMPLCFGDLIPAIRARRPQAILMMLAPPDENGFCSFGADAHFLGDLWEDAPIRIAHINPNMKSTPGYPGVPFSKLTAYFEAPQDLLSQPTPQLDDKMKALGGHVAGWVDNGSTIQIGIGKVASAALQALRDHKNLRIFSGLIIDDVLDLFDAGALAPGNSVTAGVAIGSERLYSRIGKAPFVFHPVSTTHDLHTLSRQEKLVTINSAISVDLFGQAYSEATHKGPISGPGGATDFARGARAAGGLRIIALPSTAGRDGRISKICLPSEAFGPVSLSRMDIDVVVTEHGSADLRGKTIQTRAKALIDIAAPAHRESLARKWESRI